MRDAENCPLALARIAKPVADRDFVQFSTVGMIFHTTRIASKHMVFIIILSTQWTCLEVEFFFEIIGEQRGINFSDLRTVGNSVG